MTAINWSDHPSNAQRMGLANGTAAVADFVSPEQFALEREKIFRRSWLIVGRVEELPEPGRFIRADLDTLGISAVIVRGKDGVLRAFHNTCSHRGVALVQPERGRANTFSCPYHAWLYGLDGRLRAIPSERDFQHVDKASHGLTPIALDTWNGFIFLNACPEPPTTLHDFLGGLGTAMDGMAFEDYPFMMRYQEDVASNWKLLIHAFNEGYHIPFLHTKTLDPQLATADNPFLQYHQIRCFGPHTASTLQRNYAWRPTTPALAFAISQVLPASVPGEGAPAGRRSLIEHPGINPSGIENFGTEVVTIFPNTLLQPLSNGFLLFLFWPTAANRMRVDVRIHAAAPPANLREEFAMAHTLAQSRDVLTEDLSMSTIQQRGLAGGGRQTIHFGQNEAHLRYFSKVVADALAA